MKEGTEGVWGHFSKAWPYHCERLEPAFDGGLPDVLLQDIHGRAGLAELKAPDKLDLRQTQRIWIRRWQQQGSIAIPTVTCMNDRNKIVWKVMRYSMKYKAGWGLRAALERDEGRWLSRDEMVHLVLIMNGLEPYLVTA